jgi:hypothetical protein
VEVLQAGKRPAETVPSNLHVRLFSAQQSSFQARLMRLLVSLFTKKKMDINLGKMNDQKDLWFLFYLIEKRKLSPVKDRRISLNEIPDTLRDLSLWLVTGNVVVTVALDDYC